MFLFMRLFFKPRQYDCYVEQEQGDFKLWIVRSSKEEENILLATLSLPSNVSTPHLECLFIQCSDIITQPHDHHTFKYHPESRQIQMVITLNCLL